MALHNEIGKKGEKEAQNYLQANDYEIVETNYRFKKCEIDIIAKKHNLMIFVEVKTRSSAKFGLPEHFLSQLQQRRIALAGSNYLEENNLHLEVRFDIISIVKGKEILHIKDAFYPID